MEDQIYGKLMEIFRTDLPVTFLCPSVSMDVVHRRICGLSSACRTHPVAHMEELWIEDVSREP